MVVIETSRDAANSMANGMPSRRRPAAASKTCSQLFSATLIPGCGMTPRTAATTSGTAAGSPTAANSTTNTPSGKSCAKRAANSNASRVLPTPPTPVNVTKRWVFNAVCRSVSCASRPMKLVVGCRRFPGVGSSVIRGENRSVGQNPGPETCQRVWRCRVVGAAPRRPARRRRGGRRCRRRAESGRRGLRPSRARPG